MKWRRFFLDELVCPRYACVARRKSKLTIRNHLEFQKRVFDLLSSVRSSLSDRYEVERELGHGGMATVYLARDIRHRRPVAVKVLHPELAITLGAERFLREIEVVAQLQHPHILPLHDSGEVSGLLFYVMPYVDGGSLRDRLSRQGQLPLDEVQKITSDVASALEYAHSHGVVHRDVKPENILFSSGKAVLSDFGIARAVSPDQASLTQTGTIVGTLAYMSPEQATGGAVIDGHSDQYSLGCVVYEMLVGQPPFTASTPQGLIARHTLDVVSRPSVVRPTVRGSMEAAVIRALAKTPADRFATVQGFADAMDAPVAESRTARREPSWASPNAVSPSRVRRIAAWGALGVAIVAGAVIFATMSQRFGRASNTANELDPRHIAVTYFRDQTPNGELGYLADGITEALIRQLAAVPDLHVVSAGGVAPFRDARVPIDSIARTLNVGTVIQGGIEQSGDRVRVNVSLVNGADGRVVDTKALERQRSDVFALQDTLSEEVAFFLRRRIGDQMLRLETSRGTRDAAAWELVQRAKATAGAVSPLLAAGDTAGASRELARADSFLIEAAARDQRWAKPVAERGWLTDRRLNLVGTFDKNYYAEWVSKGILFAEQALTLQANDPNALRLRGRLRYFQFVFNLAPPSVASSQLVADAEADLRASAVPENPDQAAAWSLLSHLLMRTGRVAEGKLAAMRAYESDPYLADAATIIWRLYSTSLDLEDGAEAKRWCIAGQHRFPDNPFFTECQLSVNALASERPSVPQLWQLLERNVSQYAPNAREYRRRRGELFVAMGLVRAGLPDSARAVALRTRADATIDPSRDLVYLEAIFRSILGDRDEALRLLTFYLATNPQDRASQAADSTWWWRGIREDPRYQALVRSGR